MDNHHINNHICNNHQRAERNFCTRLEKELSYCDMCDNKCINEHGGDVYVANIEKAAYNNRNYRESVWTGKYLQMTLMSIPRSQSIGIEMHDDTDQFIRVEHGTALLVIGNDSTCLSDKKKLYKGDAVLVPAGVWHDIMNIGKCPLKLSSIYAPPHHPKCTVEKNKR